MHFRLLVFCVLRTYLGMLQIHSDPPQICPPIPVHQIRDMSSLLLPDEPTSTLMGLSGASSFTAAIPQQPVAPLSPSHEGFGARGLASEADVIPERVRLQSQLLGRVAGIDLLLGGVGALTPRMQSTAGPTPPPPLPLHADLVRSDGSNNSAGDAYPPRCPPIVDMHFCERRLVGGLVSCMLSYPLYTIVLYLSRIVTPSCSPSQSSSLPCPSSSPFSPPAVPWPLFWPTAPPHCAEVPARRALWSACR